MSDPCTGFAIVVIAVGIWGGTLILDLSLGRIARALEEIARKLK